MKILPNYQYPPIPSDEQKALISVVIPAYNIAPYLERGVNSVLNQTYRNLEIILVDDGSTDGSGQICDRLEQKDDRLTVIHKENGGPAEARNAGLKIAEGSFIGFVDGDDWIDADMYERMLGALLAEQADMAVCRYRRVYKDRVEDASTDRLIVFEGQEALQYYVEEREEYDIQNAAWNKLYRREILEGLQFPLGKWYEDILFSVKALGGAGRCVYLDRACYNYIIDREGSIMNTKINPRTFTDQIPAYWERSRFLRSLGRQDLADIHDYFVCKRLLLFYNELKKSREPGRKRYLQKITDIIYKNRNEYDRIYRCGAANPNERRKMELFLKSPVLYWCAMRINEAVVLPMKTRRKGCKGWYDNHPDGGRAR
ncbi:MAG: glycosyltransferase [Blautia sp.]|nr:glycosyltransferase [Blautia sp.]MCM1200914.1 glycosyltransferase [Bacteroides fragilis]